MMGGRLWTVVGAGVLLVGCSGSGGATPSTTSQPGATSAPVDLTSVAEATTTSTTAPPTTTVPPTTTAAPVPSVPAGMQFTAAPVATPADAAGLIGDGTTVVMMGTAPTTVRVCPRGVGGCTKVAKNPVVHVGSPTGGFNTVPVDDIAAYPLPTGYRQPNNGLTPVAVAKGSAGYVMAGNANIWDSNLFHNVAERAVLWFSPDAVAWQRVDLRDVVGDTNMMMHDVVSTDSGFIAVGEVTGAANLSQPSTGLVLTSGDGLNWTRGPDLALPWSVTLVQLVAHGNEVLLRGREYECTADSGAMNDFSLGGQDRLWGSADGGVTFTPVDLTSTGVASDMPAPPTDPSQCGPFGTAASYSWGFGLVDQADGTFVLGSKDGTKVSSSTDLLTWKSATLPGATPSKAVSAPVPTQRIVTSSPDGLFVLSLEQRRDETGAQLDFGLQVLGWKSTDHGATFTTLPATRPLKSALHGLVKLTNGSVASIATTRDPATGIVGPAMFVSTAGPLAAWGSCTPAPAADCSFATLAPATSFATMDLHGIDLTGVSLVAKDFDGANLTGASLAGAQVSGATFKGANLTGVSMAGLKLTDVDFTGATMQSTDFSDASLAGATLQGEILHGAVLAGASFELNPAVPSNDVDLSGMDLQRATFEGELGTTGVMQRTNFAGAQLGGASFRDVDLTGSNFDGASLVDQRGLNVIFASGVICPDGASYDPTKYGAAACRL